MEKEFKFKTTINCGGCVAKVTPVLDEAEGVQEWKVDTDNPDKILTVKSNGITEDKVIEKIKSRGFKIEPVK